MNKLALGTAQFGLNYGIANQNGQIKFSDINKILRLAKNSDIDLIDTAIAYGDSEKIIGDIGIVDFKFISKLPALPKNCNDISSWVEEKVQSSLLRLGIPSLYGLLVHKSDNLLGDTGKKLIEALKRIKLSGLVKKIGISIYDPSECEKIMGLTRIDIVQAPLNIVDQRLVISGWLSRLHSEEIEIHTRSVFLQGLLLMPHNKIPRNFDKWLEVLDEWSLKLKKNNLCATEVCLSYPLSLPEVDRVIVGVDNVNQLDEIINKSKSQPSQIDWSFMVSNDQMLINPSNWRNS
ncbi:aldo/keto reductase [Candidatus Pelagibacter sp.]|nr:aldo/keto reductase [Candidatus Pelagibacter sp.]MDA9199963.1 aldo/keto reductase [Candidatus Pelagibacter sp.]